MTDEKKLILPQDLEEGEIIKEILLSNYPLTLFISPGMTVGPKDYERATVVIASSNSDQVSTLAAEQDLPENTPILFLGTGDRLPSVCSGNGTSRLVDYLRVPVSKEIFLHKISLLSQVQKISSKASKQVIPYDDCDNLTGLYNRRHFASRLSEIFFSSRECNKELSLIIININNIGDLCALLGAEFGIYILKQISVRLTQTIRDIDKWYRFSSEEFIVILPEADLRFASATAQKINEACAGRSFSDGSHTISITISIGIASLKTHQPDDPNNFIFMAEKALFEAKTGGQDCICISTHKDNEDTFPPFNPLAFLQDRLGSILKTAKSSALSSLEYLAENVAGSDHKAQITAVSHLISLFGSHIGIPAKHIQNFHNSIILYNYFRALLHYDLLAKPDKLTWDERKIIEDLPYKLTELADMLDYFADEKSLLLSFNERYDGTGYPDGLKGDEIPLGARLFHLVDALAAMNADRPYRKKLSPREIIKELKQGAGRQFDPFLVFQLLTVIEQNGLIDIDPEFLIQTRQNIMNSFTQHRP